MLTTKCNICDKSALLLVDTKVVAFGISMTLCRNCASMYGIRDNFGNVVGIVRENKGVIAFSEMLKIPTRQVTESVISL